MVVRHPPGRGIVLERLFGLALAVSTNRFTHGIQQRAEKCKDYLFVRNGDDVSDRLYTLHRKDGWRSQPVLCRRESAYSQADIYIALLDNVNSSRIISLRLLSNSLLVPTGLLQPTPLCQMP